MITKVEQNQNKTSLTPSSSILVLALTGFLLPVYQAQAAEPQLLQAEFFDNWDENKIVAELVSLISAPMPVDVPRVKPYVPQPEPEFDNDVLKQLIELQQQPKLSEHSQQQDKLLTKPEMHLTAPEPTQLMSIEQSRAILRRNQQGAGQVSEQNLQLNDVLQGNRDWVEQVELSLFEQEADEQLAELELEFDLMADEMAIELESEAFPEPEFDGAERAILEEESEEEAEEESEEESEEEAEEEPELEDDELEADKLEENELEEDELEENELEADEFEENELEENELEDDEFEADEFEADEFEADELEEDEFEEEEFEEEEFEEELEEEELEEEELEEDEIDG